MMTHLPGMGMAVICDRTGMVQSILQDDLAIDGLGADGPLLDLLTPDSRAKGERFLRTLREDGLAENWELNVRLEGRIVPLLFGGVSSGETMVVLAARSRSSLARTYEELMRINNEQTNILRDVMKQQAVSARRLAEQDIGLYDELSRLNNELSTTQRELVKKNVELERLNQQKNQFLGMAAHDMRNPLGVILTYADFLLEEWAGRLDEEPTRFIGVIKSSSRFMLDLVNDLLDVSKIEAGVLGLSLAMVDLAKLVERNVGLNRTLAEPKQIGIDLVIPEAIPPLLLDSAKIEQVLNNLITNAIKFSDPGSRIAVTLGAGDEVTIAVKDHGPGMSADEVEKIFRPFHRGHAVGTRGEKGTGLGLVIVKRIVEGHGGSIRVESAPGAGSTFLVSLPAGRTDSPERTTVNMESRQ
jgi:signal transduction histidine kinase